MKMTADCYRESDQENKEEKRFSKKSILEYIWRRKTWSKRTWKGIQKKSIWKYIWRRETKDKRVHKTKKKTTKTLTSL